MTALPKQNYTFEEYLELDANSEVRLEYWDGKILPLSDEVDQQATIEENLVGTLNWEPVCVAWRFFPSTTRVKAPGVGVYRYADLTAVCPPARFETFGGIQVLTNPQLIVEITSAATEARDRGDKFSYYKSIPSFTEYLVIAQYCPYISQFIKLGDNRWEQREFCHLDEKINLTSLDCELQVGNVYLNFTFSGSYKPSVYTSDIAFCPPLS
jgi:Uma2 family endonuclease